MRTSLLLGSTALVSAGLLMAGGTQAQETRVGGIEVVLGGFTPVRRRGRQQEHDHRRRP
ncbi:MAG: hypothetical protein ACREJ5_05960 [Geminicoccaceae bacterium]